MLPSFRGRIEPQTTLRLEEILAKEPCPVCVEAEEWAAAWFASYQSETNADPAMKVRLSRSLGLCTAHTRRLLDTGPAASWLAGGLFAEVTRAGLQRFTGGPAGRAEQCPPCAAADRRVTSLLELLRTSLAHHAAIRDAYAAGSGVCLRHLAGLVTGAPPAVTRLAADRAVRTLEAGPAEATGALAGADPDLRRRAERWAPHREAVLRAEEQAARRSTAALVELMLTTPACPVCTASQRAQWRLLDWLGSCGIAAAELQLDAACCGRHLGDLAAIGWQDRADEVARYNADRVLAALRPAVTRLGAARRTPFSRRASARTLAAVFRPVPCRACRAAGLAERDERRLLTIVAGDASRRAQLAEAHGVCLGHGLALSREAALPAAWRDLLVTRLRLLGYELDRATRQTARDGRWRMRGVELTAWTRAPTLLDGAVLGPRVRA